MMNGKNQKYNAVLFAIVIPSFIVLAIPFGGTLIFQKAAGQEQQNITNTTSIISGQISGIANQTNFTVDPMQNQTVANQTGTAALSANLTQSDFESITQDLTEARQALQNNDTNTVLDELNSASGELFQVISRQFDPAHVEAMTQEFNPLQSHIDLAQEAMLKDDFAKTIEEINSADSELLKVTELLPSSEEQED
ncbi:hypothetical protein BH18THE2_BH18THE2_31010 [soil metagenome]